MLRLAVQIFLNISVVNQDVHPCKMSATDFLQECYFCRLKTQSKRAQNRFFFVPLTLQFDPLTIFMQIFTNFG